MATTLVTLDKIREINATFPYTAPIKAWKAQGKKVVGFQCVHVPEEIIYAAGILPVRLTGDTKESELEEANSYMYMNYCSFIRTCLQLTLDGQFSFLDGYVGGGTCDCARRLADIFDHYHLTPFVHILSVPRKIDGAAYEAFRLQLMDMKRALEEHFKVEITDEKLWKAVEVYNKGRDLLRQLHELKKLDAPPITGAETLEVLNASRRMPPEQFNELMEKLLEEARTGGRAIKPRYRLMINGSPLNNPEFIKTIESQGALVVIDELCTGIRYWWEGVDPDPDPLKAIAKRYLHNFACPRMEPSEDRFIRVMKLVKQYRVDGVVNGIVRHCVPWAHDEPMLRRKLEAKGIPVLELDLEYGTGSPGPILTRIEAFLEMLETK